MQDHPDAKVCCLRMDNLEFLSRHYGILMRVHCKRMVTTSLQPFLQKDERLFQLPGSELVLVLLGPGTAERLQHMVDQLNSRKIVWNNTGLDIEFGASREWLKTVRSYTIRWGSSAGWLSNLAERIMYWRSPIASRWHQDKQPSGF